MMARRLRARLWVILGIIVSMTMGCSSASPSTTARSHATATPVVQSDPTATSIPATPTNTPIFQDPLLPFSDWRLAYMGPEGRIHVITLDRKTEIIGPLLPLVPPGQPLHAGSGIDDGGFAPDGHTLAFMDDYLSLIDTATGHEVIIPPSPQSAGNDIAWASDGKTFAFNGDTAFELIQTSNGKISSIPHTPFPGTPPEATNLDGWIDATHIAVDGFLPSTIGQSKITFVLWSLNVITGDHWAIAQITIPSLEIGALTFDPDGTTALFYTVPFRDNPYTSYVAKIDITSGAITPLPVIAQLQSQNSIISNFAWRPGAEHWHWRRAFRKMATSRTGSWMYNTTPCSSCPPSAIHNAGRRMARH